MFKKFVYFLMLIATMFVAFSCEKDEPLDNPTDVPNTTLGTYDMVIVSEDGSFSLNGVDYTLNSYLLGNSNLKSANGELDKKVYFKPFIYGDFNEKLNLLFAEFPTDTATNMLFDEFNYRFGEEITEDNYVIDNGDTTIQITRYTCLNTECTEQGDSTFIYTPDELVYTPDNIANFSRLTDIDHVGIDEEFTIVDNRIMVNYNNINYSFDMTVLRIETNELFLEAVVDDIDTVLFFNAELYFDSDNGQVDRNPNSLVNAYLVADEFGYYSNTQNHISDSTIADRVVTH